MIAVSAWRLLMVPLGLDRSLLLRIDSWGFVRLAADYTPGYGVACLRQAAGML